MPSNVVWQSDASETESSEDFGAIDPGSNSVVKVFLTNLGTSVANSVIVRRVRVGGNDGVDYTSIAQNDGTNNPGAYSTDEIFIGDLNPGVQIPLWIKAAVPNSGSNRGNPRVFEWEAAFVGT